MSKIITLCGRARCCPKVVLPTTENVGGYKDNDIVKIKDDYGNTVKMTWEQFIIMCNMKW